MANTYAKFLSMTTKANKSIKNYTALDARTAGKIAKYEVLLMCVPGAVDAFKIPDTATRDQALKNLSIPEKDLIYATQAYRNITTNNTLLDPKSLQQYKDEVHHRHDKDGYSYYDGLGTVEDNVYLTWAAAGTGDRTRTLDEIWNMRADIKYPYKLNANYVPEGASKTLSNSAPTVGKRVTPGIVGSAEITSGDTTLSELPEGVKRTTSSNTVVSVSPTAPKTPTNTGDTITPTTPTAPKNPYQNANGSYNTTAINNFLKAFGYGNVEVPELKGFSAVDPLAGKSLSDRDLKVLEAVQNSGLKDLLTNEFYKSIVDGADYATWAEANGMTEANGFSKTAFDQAYSDAAKAKNETLSQQYKNAVNALYQALGAEDNIIAQELRKAAAQAQASRASAGMAAANQLSAALSRTQQNSDEALKIAQSGIELGKEMAENDAAAIVEALNKWTATHQKNVELKNNADSNRVQGGAAVLGYAGDVVNAETAADQTRTDSALRTNATNQSAVAAENTAKTDIYSTKKGAQSSILNSLIDGNVNQAMNNATNNTNLTIANKNNEATMLETMAALGEKGYTFKNNKVYDKNGKVVYG